LADVLKASAESKPIVFVDPALQMVETRAGGIRLSDSEQRTVSAGHLEAVVHGTYVYFVTGGRVVAERDAVLVGKQPPVGISFYRPIADFDGLLRDHAKQDVAKERSFRYWANKNKRLLLAKPEKTEKIFQRALYNWLDCYVSDKLRVIAETREFGQDPTDVLVVTVQGDYVVEVKWLGENEHGTHYEQERINEGLRQVRQYIANDPRIVQGHVVLYDARTEEEYGTQSSHDEGCRHEFCSEPKIIYLESESPSQKAKAKKPVKATSSPKPGKRNRKGKSPLE
jgi:hypothetical protein